MCDVAIFKAVALFRNDKRDRYLPLQRVLHADHSHFGNVRIAGNTLLYLTRPQPMPGHVDDIIRTAKDEVIAVRIANTPVKGGVHLTRKQRPVGIHKPRVITPDSLDTARRQRPFNHQHALFIRFAGLTGHLIEQLHVISVHRHAWATQPRRAVVQPASDRHNRPTGFSLPVVVDNRDAQRFRYPTGGRFIQRLTRQIQHLQRGEIVIADLRGREFLQHADGGWGGEHPADLILLNNFPPYATVWIRWQPFVNHCRHPRQQRGIHDIRMPNYPADIRRAEEHTARFTAENGVHRGRQRDRVAANVALDAFRFTGCPGGVENAGRFVRLQPGNRYPRAEMLLAQRGKVEVSPLYPRHFRQTAID